MSNDHEVPDMNMIIIKRGHAQEEHPHGGAWKVAFADFMTAMMAFFLVLWIVNSTNKETRSSVARYFNPIRISDTTAARKGLKDPHENDFDAASSEAEEKARPKTAGAGKEGQTGPASGNGGQGSSVDTVASKEPDAGVLDPVTARDPFIVLDEIAGRATGASAASGLAPSAQADLGLDGPVPFRDPFAPPAPVLPPEAKPLSRDNGTVLAPPKGQQQQQLAQREAKAQQAAAPNPGFDPPATGAARAETPNASREAARDLDRIKEAPAPARDSEKAKDAGEAAKEGKGALQQAVAEAAALRDSISRILREVGLAQGPKLDVRVIDDGILISLTDNLNFGMFAVGSAEPQPRVVAAMQKMGEALAKESGTFIIRGHTDARPYKSRAYDNWRLSSSRAQMAAYMLMRGRLDERRIERIEGHADRALRNTKDPLAPENRRIEILLRRPK